MTRRAGRLRTPPPGGRQSSRIDDRGGRCRSSSATSPAAAYLRRPGAARQHHAGQRRRQPLARLPMAMASSRARHRRDRPDRCRRARCRRADTTPDLARRQAASTSPTTRTATSRAHPAGAARHTFCYTARDELDVHARRSRRGDQPDGYTYDADRQPLASTAPTGRRWASSTTPPAAFSRGCAAPATSYGYDAAGRLTSLSTADVALAYAYDGGLPTGTTWSGAVAGSVTRTYDTASGQSVRVNGVDPSRRLRRRRPALRSAPSPDPRRADGLVTATALGAISDSHDLRRLRRLRRLHRHAQRQPVYAADLHPRRAGAHQRRPRRLAARRESFGYTYDLAGGCSRSARTACLPPATTTTPTASRLDDDAYDAQDRLLQHGAATYAHSPNGERLQHDSRLARPRAISTTGSAT